MKHHRPDSNRFALNAFGALSLATVLLTGAAQAATTTSFQTLEFAFTGNNQLSFGKFNTSLGNLISVTLDWTTQSKINLYSITNTSTNNLGAANVTYRETTFSQTFDAFVPAVDESGVAVTHIANTVLDDPNPNLILAPNASYSVSNKLFAAVTDSVSITSLDASFNSFKGAGSVPLFLTNSFGNNTNASVSGTSGTLRLGTELTGSTTGSLGVTYTYEVAAVPEPSDLLLCAAPALLGGAGLMRRNRKSRKQLA